MTCRSSLLTTLDYLKHLNDLRSIDGLPNQRSCHFIQINLFFGLNKNLFCVRTKGLVYPSPLCTLMYAATIPPPPYRAYVLNGWSHRQQELQVSNLLGPPKSENELCCANVSEAVSDNIDLGEMSKTDNDISEFDELMENYVASQELLNIELTPVEKGKKVVSPKRETFQPVNISNFNVSINYYNGEV